MIQIFNRDDMEVAAIPKRGDKRTGQSSKKTPTKHSALEDSFGVQQERGYKASLMAIDNASPA